jgi:hypothetical protein
MVRNVARKFIPLIYLVLGAPDSSLTNTVLRSDLISSRCFLISMLWISVSPCSFFGNTGGGIVSSVLSESESGTSSAFAADAPVAAVVVAAIVVAAIVATGFTLFCCRRGGVPDAFHLP